MSSKPGPQISVIVSGLSHLYPDGIQGLLATARIADGVGIHQLAVTDHLAIGRRLDRYPYGRFPFSVEEPWPEPLTTLATIAGATSRIRLATAVLIAPLRPALLLAKTAATLDVLSGGRLDLGVGLGWQPEEFDAAGVDFEERAARMDDVLRACRVLWRDAPARFASPSVSFEELWCEPRPVQPGGVPLWFGLRLSARNVARIVEMGAGWMPLVAHAEDLWAGAERLRSALADAGRDPDELGIRAPAEYAVPDAANPGLEQVLEQLPTLAERGATVASFALARYARRPEEIAPFLERLGRAAE